jgi:hypothetical protein
MNPGGYDSVLFMSRLAEIEVQPDLLKHIEQCRLFLADCCLQGC